MANPNTPAKVSGIQAIISNDTPFSKGSGSHQNHSTQHARDDYEPYLAEDIKREYKVTPDQFLHDVLRLSLEELDPSTIPKVKKIMASRKYQRHIEAYCQECTKEPMRYAPFTSLVEYIFKELSPKQAPEDICLCRNDPVIVQGSAGARKPDVVGIHRRGIDQRGSIDDMNERGPASQPFSWRDLVSFWEFKYVSKLLPLPLPYREAILCGSNSLDYLCGFFFLNRHRIF